MSYSAAIGPIEFQFSGSGIAPVPAVTGVYVLDVDGTALMALDEGGELFLLLDHRTYQDVAPAAYVEFWQPAAMPEARVRGLLILSEPHHQATITDPPATLAELVARLQPYP
jgi:hypothetical protein